MDAKYTKKDQEYGMTPMEYLNNVNNGGSRPQPPVTVQADGMPTASVTFTATK